MATRADAKAAMYLHCRRCVEEGVRPNIESFVDKNGVLWVWCRNHDIEVYHTRSSVMDVSQMTCGACESTVPHAH